ncbi:hypothetical protein [Cryptosporangium aurantiacum]|uniref:hypothetical protein n=1 Tax=Cryptosporangium aurantiacum TaxID=134849 RepID=UPI0015B8D9FA|nr:hypothetical protein [Cryptosporangium aurantiacum]
MRERRFTSGAGCDCLNRARGNLFYLSRGVRCVRKETAMNHGDDAALTARLTEARGR